MGSDTWTTRTVSDLQQEGTLLVEDGNHGEYRPRPEEFEAVGVAFIRAADMDAGRVLFQSASRINATAMSRIRKGIGQPGDVLVSHKGTVGKVAFAPLGCEPFVCSPQTTFYRVRNTDILDRRFLYYYLNSDTFQNQLAAYKGESDMADYVSLTVQRTLKISYPIPSVQRHIGQILGTLDDKIEVNRRVNETLEAMAGAVFRSWFVDFDPVRAKADGRKPEGMDAATAKLFPDKFEDSPLGSVPKGWRVMRLPEAIEVNPRRSLPKGVLAPYLDMSNMPTQSARATTWEMREGGSGARFINGDVLLARITPCLENGKTAFVDFLPDGEAGWGSTEYIVLRSKQPLPEEYAYFLARSPELRMFAIQNMTGTSGRQRVPAECFSNFCVVVPPDGLTRRFGDLAKVAMSQMKARDEESATLAATRDALLPKLLSGEFRVSDSQSARKETL